MNQVLDDPYGDKTLNNWFNPAAFAQPALGTHGNSGRNAYEGPGSRVLDLSLVRSFRFMDTHRIEARIEAFNAFNWFRWGNPDQQLQRCELRADPDVAGDPRIMQFALKYRSEGWFVVGSWWLETQGPGLRAQDSEFPGANRQPLTANHEPHTANLSSMKVP